MTENIIQLYDDGKRKHQSIEAKTQIEINLVSNYSDAIEFECYGSSEKEAVDNLIDNVEDAAKALNERLQQLKAERDKANYSDKDVTSYGNYD